MKKTVCKWDILREDVNRRISFLQITDENLPNNKTSAMIRRDLIMPWAKRLAEFCASVKE